jgi:mannose-6-phosphate isomerase
MNLDRENQTARVKELAENSNLSITIIDPRPWGVSFMLDEAQLDEFARIFFPDLELPPLDQRTKMSPKFLLVAPGGRLSWQYHHRRSEHWRVAWGPLGVAMSDTDDESEPKVYKVGDEIHLKKGVRHRLAGLDGWGLIAEIWKHSDPTNPSDEQDIIRLQDDYKRN